MNTKTSAVLLGAALSLMSAGVSYGMSELVYMSKDPVWPATSSPDGKLVYNVTTVGRSGSGLLEVTLTAGNMPPGVTVVFNPSVLRFTGNQLSSQTATMTVTCTNLVPLDCFPFTITGTAQRETVTVTNEVLYTPEALATRVPTLFIDKVAEGGYRVRGAGATGKTYDIEWTPSVANPTWMKDGTCVADANGRFTFYTAKALPSSPRFFRAVTTPEPVAR